MEGGSLHLRGAEAAAPREHLDTLFGILHDAVLFARFPDRRVLGVNDAFLRLFRVTRERALEGTTAFIHVDDEHFRRFGELMRPAFEHGQPLVRKWHFRRADGSTFVGEITVSPVRPFDGSPVGAVSIIRDVTAAETTRTEAQRRSAAIVELVRSLKGEDLARDLAAATEAAATGLRVRRASVWLFTEGHEAIECVELYDAAEGRSSGHRIRAADAPSYFAALEEARVIDASDATRDARTSEFTEAYLEPLGIASMLDAPLWVSGRLRGVVCHEHCGSVRAWTDDDRAFAGTMADLVAHAIQAHEVRQAERDLTQARAELARSEKMSALGSLVGGVAHEIRTPLTFLANSLELARRDIERLGTSELRERVAKPLDDARDGIERINRLVGDLRRFTTNNAANAKAPHALDEVVRDAVRLFGVTHRGEARVVERLDPVPPRTMDRMQVQQIVLNLMENAREARPADGTITIRTFPQEDAAVLEVTDRGTGIPRDVLDKMWREFFTTKENGSGLGLAIVRRIVESHGGIIACESVVGAGTTFRVKLP